jgi:Concanavalin A-like lectin/glucanases superfamily
MKATTPTTGATFCLPPPRCRRCGIRTKTKLHAGRILPVLSFHARMIAFLALTFISATTTAHADGCIPPPAGLAYWWQAEGNALDFAGGNNGTLQGGVTFTNGEVGQAFSFDGSSGFVSTSLLVTNPQMFSLCLWFKTGSTNGGGLISFDSTQTDTSGSQYDRNIYMDNAGLLHFGIWDGSAQQANSTTAYNDGNWHLAVGTLSPTAGLSLYVDGALVGTNLANNAQDYNGYWRFGQANLNNWLPLPNSEYFQGQLDEIAVFNTRPFLEPSRLHLCRRQRRDVL